LGLVDNPDRWKTLKYERTFRARPDQFPPQMTRWFLGLLLRGRGAGKTRTGSEWIHQEAMAGDERRRMALIGKTPGDVRDVMIEGISGILTIAPPKEKPDYQPTKRRLTWPSGATATVYSGANPEQTRGFSGDRAWCDEVCAWKYPQDTWDNLMFGMREAQLDDPRVFVSTTPKPQPLIKWMLAKCEDPNDPLYYLTRTSSYANRMNLSEIYYETVIKPMEGTTLGMQEIYARILADDPNAHWKREWLDANRITPERVPDLTDIMISVDPAMTSGEDSNEHGIVAGGVNQRTKNHKQHGYVLEDYSGIYTSKGWAEKAIWAYHEHKADAILYEANQGGDLVRDNIHSINANIKCEKVWATKGKHKRFEPIANLDEQGRIHHVGTFGDMEDQMCTWYEGVRNMPSPDRADARSHLFHRLMIGTATITDFGSLDDNNMKQEPGWVPR
jgi:phage terminase large subunit-like protein